MSTDDKTYRAAAPAFDDRPAPPPTPGSSPPPPRSSRWPGLIAVLAVLVLAAGVLTTLLIRRGDDRPATPDTRSTGPTGTSAAASPSPSTTASASTTASNAPTTSTPTQTAPALLPRGAEAARHAIPWAQVDDGWSLRAWSSKSDPYATPLTPSTLFLVNPVGGRYRIATVPPDTFPVAWSPGRRYAVLHSFDLLREYDLTTGRQLASFTLGNRTLIGYAGPGAHSLLLINPAVGDPGARFEVVNTSGRHQRTLPDGTSASGRFLTALYRPDNSSLLIAGQHGFVVLGSDDHVIRQIAYPAGAQQCYAAHWWSAQVAMGSCHYLTPGHGSGVDNLVLIPVDGRAVSLLTHSTSPYHTYIDAWRYSGGVVAAVASGSCGIADLATLDAAGNSHPYSYRMPAGVSGVAKVLGVHADRVTLMTGGCDARKRSIVSLDLRTGATTALLGPGLNGGSVWR